MRSVERVREALPGAPPSPDYFRQRAFAGWKPVAIVWEREIESETPQPRCQEVPFGLEIAPDGGSLIENPAEKEIILKVIEGIVADQPMSSIAAALNARGLRTRCSAAWTPLDVFELLPRLIEVGPSVFPTAEWAERRRRLFHAT
jgi:hypothetical protein